MADQISGQYLTLRFEIENSPGTFAQLASAIASAGGNLGSVDIVASDAHTIVRDIGVQVRDDEHGDHLVTMVRSVPGVHLVNVSDHILQIHVGGKLTIQPKFSIKNRTVWSQAYWPGVARVCRTIQRNPQAVHAFTIKKNSVAIVTDGSAVIGLGDIGPHAAIPVMEGKAMIYRDFAAIDAFPIALDTRDPQRIVEAIVAIAPVFGIINLEDIESARCFQIEEKLRGMLDIPIFHDVHDGSSIVVLAGLYNALRVVSKKIEDVRIVIMGISHRSMALAKLLREAGARAIVACDNDGAMNQTRAGTTGDPVRDWFALHTNPDGFQGSLTEALQGADVLLGMQPQGKLGADSIKTMCSNAIVFHIGDPSPEMAPGKLLGIARVVATNRADTPNQLNSAVASPGVLRGALDINASTINSAMKLAAAQALADVIQPGELYEDHILPSMFNPEVTKSIAKAVAAAALKSGVGRRRRGKVVPRA